MVENLACLLICMAPVAPKMCLKDNIGKKLLKEQSSTETEKENPLSALHDIIEQFIFCLKLVL